MWKAPLFQYFAGIRGTCMNSSVCLRLVSVLFVLAFSPLASLQTSTFQAANLTTGAHMSLIRKSDVKNHLSTRNAAQLPSGLAPKAVATSAEAAAVDKEAPAQENPDRPLHLIDAEPVANAQVGGSVGVPANEPWRPRKL